MPYRMHDDSVTVRGKGHPEYSGKSVTVRGEQRRQTEGPEPGRYDAGDQPDGTAPGKSTARDLSSVRARGPVSPKMPELI